MVGRRVARIEVLLWRSPPPLSYLSAVAEAVVLFVLLVVLEATVPLLALRVVACEAAAEIMGVCCTLASLLVAPVDFLAAALASLLAAPVVLLAPGGGAAERLALHAATQLVELLQAPVQLLLLLLPELLLLLPEVLLLPYQQAAELGGLGGDFSVLGRGGGLLGA